MLDEIAQLLIQEDNIALLPHVSADGDAIGSSLALHLALRKLGKRSSVILEEKVPVVYEFMPGVDSVAIYNGAKEIFPVTVALDTGDIERLGTRAEIFNKSRIKINIDHHVTNTSFAQINHIDTESSASGEIIYELIKLMKVQLDADISSCIYVAVATDTGGFRYSNTTSVTHCIAGELIKNGANIAELSRAVFDTTSLEKVKLMGAAINTLQFYEDNRIAFITVTDDILGQTGAADEDLDGIVNLARNIRGVEAAAVLREKSGSQVKVSLRSNSYADVAVIAKSFGGGGHQKAAGFTAEGSLNEIREQLLNKIRNYVKS